MHPIKSNVATYVDFEVRDDKHVHFPEGKDLAQTKSTESRGTLPNLFKDAHNAKTNPKSILRREIGKGLLPVRQLRESLADDDYELPETKVQPKPVRDVPPMQVAGNMLPPSTPEDRL